MPQPDPYLSLVNDRLAQCATRSLNNPRAAGVEATYVVFSTVCLLFFISILLDLIGNDAQGRRNALCVFMARPALPSSLARTKRCVSLCPATRSTIYIDDGRHKVCIYLSKSPSWTMFHRCLVSPQWRGTVINCGSDAAAVYVLSRHCIRYVIYWLYRHFVSAVPCSLISKWAALSSTD